MARRSPPPAPKRRVWRITEAAPLGEFVDPDAPAPKPSDSAPAPAGTERSSGWIVSSAELREGSDVDDRPDTVPDDLFDELFPPPPAPPEK